MSRESTAWRRSSSAGSTPKSTAGSKPRATTSRLPLRGKAAVAQAKLAYQLFLERFSGPRWEALQAKGRTRQRPLWASTSTKNPAYPDLLYVDSLIGPDTVNTMPDATVAAFLDHGTVARTIDQGGRRGSAPTSRPSRRPASTWPTSRPSWKKRAWPPFPRATTSSSRPSKTRPTMANEQGAQRAKRHSREHATTLPANPLAEGLDTVRRAPPGVLVVFGASGDLTHRKLLPALERLSRRRLLPAAFAVVGVARSEMSDDGFRDMMAEAVPDCRPGLGRDNQEQRLHIRRLLRPGDFQQTEGPAGRDRRGPGDGRQPDLLSGHRARRVRRSGPALGQGGPQPARERAVLPGWS